MFSQGFGERLRAKNCYFYATLFQIGMSLSVEEIEDLEVTVKSPLVY